MGTVRFRHEETVVIKNGTTASPVYENSGSTQRSLTVAKIAHLFEYMIYRLNIRRRSPFTSNATALFMSLYGSVFTFVSAEDGLDPAHPSARLACDLRPGAVFLNSAPVTVAATDGTRFEFEITEKDVAALEEMSQGETGLGNPEIW